MPTYSYKCADCSHAFDIVQSFSDDSLTVCPECSGRLRKVFSAAGVVFKGSGFYRTDSRGSSSKGSGGKESGGSSDSKGSGGSSDSKGTSSTSSSGSGSSGTASTGSSTS